MNEETKLNILHVTDIHSTLEMVDNVHKWLIANNEKIELILLSGDLTTMPMEYGLDASEEAEIFNPSFYEDFEKVVEAVSRINSNVYYIPGNHDVPKTYVLDSKPSPPCNVHLRCLSIAPNLYVAGLGGSVPGYQDGKKLWDGFPYRNQEEMGVDLNKLLDPLMKSETSPLTEDDQLILMTHCGPTESSTTIIMDDPLHPIISGSTALYEWLCKPEMQSKVLTNIHGHSHNSFGELQFGNISVINPGPLMEGHFGIYTLSHLPASDTTNHSRWKLMSVRRFNLV